jgi:hypothetical protein
MINQKRPKALYILQARNRQDIDFNITGKLSKKEDEGSLDRGPQWFAGFFQQVLTQTKEWCLKSNTE